MFRRTVRRWKKTMHPRVSGSRILEFVKKISFVFEETLADNDFLAESCETRTWVSRGVPPEPVKPKVLGSISKFIIITHIKTSV